VRKRFYVLVQNCPGAHSAFFTMDTGFFLGVTRLKHGVDHPTPHSAEVIEIVEVYQLISSL